MLLDSRLGGVSRGVVRQVVGTPGDRCRRRPRGSCRWGRTSTRCGGSRFLGRWWGLGSWSEGLSRGPLSIALRARFGRYVRAGGVGGGWRAARAVPRSFRIWGAPQLGDLAPLVAPQAPQQGLRPRRGLHLLDRATREGCPLQPLANGPVAGSGQVDTRGRGPRSHAAARRRLGRAGLGGC